MVQKRELSPKPILDKKSLLKAFQENGINPIHLKSVWKLFLSKGITEFTRQVLSQYNIPLKVGEILSSGEFKFLTSKVVSSSNAKDGSTTKLLIELQDGQRIETVIMRYGDVALDNYPVLQKEKLTTDGTFQFKSNKRATVCVSSQVGCAMGCTFCATGTMNLLANLNPGEILEQLCKNRYSTTNSIDHANQVEKIRNVVFMGMGEPLDNYDAVLDAVDVMIDTNYFSLSPLHVTISTVGVVPRLLQLQKDAPQIGLALSLHAPNQNLRAQIVPTSKAWHINKIMDAVTSFVDNQNKNIKSANRKRHILVEYVLIKDVNDQQEVAHELGQLLQDKSMLLNVIPYNPTDVPYDYETPLTSVAEKFVEITRLYGVHTLFRQKLGDDIASACGQLVIENAGKKSSECGGVGDMEDILDGKLKKPVKKYTSKKKQVQEQDEYKLQVIPGKLNENLPGVLIQYTILGLFCWGLYRWAAAAK